MMAVIHPTFDSLDCCAAAACLVRHHSTYHDAYAASINPETREAFWSAAAAEIDWISPPETVGSSISYNLLSFHGASAGPTIT